ncbi:MAG: tRNA pseudouridine(38-40) synthase TruA [Nitrospirota bacterium]
MKKIKLLLEYDGTAYQGWQAQRSEVKSEKSEVRSQRTVPTIQGVLEETIKKITGEDAKVIGASRTDAGVHALGQVAAFRTESRLTPETIKRALNALLPQDIKVLKVSEVDDSFHPRHDAVKKTYFYIIANQRESSAFLHRYTWMVQQPLEMKSMKKAGEVLIGTHDFSSFRGAGSSSRNPVREIFSLSIERFERLDFMTASIKGEFIKIRIEANGFLRHMVRNIAGTLVEIGRGKIPADRIEEILKSHNRRLAGPTAPANGLFLERIVY